MRLERGSGFPERSGPNWHISLLADAAIAIPGVRPALFLPNGLAEWDAVLHFRHFLRHAYVVNLDAEKLVANLARLERVVDATDAWFETVLAGLLAD